MIDTRLDERIVAGEHALGRELHADEHADIPLDRPDVRRRELEPSGSLKPAVQVHERDAGLGTRGPAGFDDVRDWLVGGFGGADILPGRAEAAVERGE